VNLSTPSALGSVPPEARSVYTFIHNCDHYYVTVRELVQATGYSEKKVRRLLQELHSRSCIHKLTSFTEEGGCGPNFYGAILEERKPE
jgi:hypothetical protein